MGNGWMATVSVAIEKSPINTVLSPVLALALAPTGNP